jgi:CRISPR-associated endonuclease/helicase Cas3
MKVLTTLFNEAPNVEQWLTNHEHYLAHLPDAVGMAGVSSETLAEHLQKVMDYARLLCEVHQLEYPIDLLIQAACASFEHHVTIAAYLKEAFINTLAFHDFGKINPFFQLDRMKNQRHFPATYPELMKPRHGHSALGAYLYLNYYVGKIANDNGLSGDEKKWLITAIIGLADAIIEHHSPRLGMPGKRLVTAIFDQKWKEWTSFLSSYNIEAAGALGMFEDSEKRKIFYDAFYKTNNFPMYALVRLNFSLLTSADNLATSDYMKQGAIEDFGLIDQHLRSKILYNIRTTEVYNQQSFHLADDSNWTPVDASEQSPDNLNQLRSQMVIEVIREIRTALKNQPDQKLFYLEAPTGGGKTNLSLLAAAEMLNLCPEANKIFYVFPFTTLITQTHQVIRKVYGLSEEEIGLMHSKAGFKEREISDGNYGGDWRNDLHLQFAHFPVCLMTHIRFFDLLKSQSKSAIYPMHRLNNSIVIIDELQSYPPAEWDKMLYFIRQYSTYFNMRFILMSATLPRIDKLNLPLATGAAFRDLLPQPHRFFQNANFCKRVNFRFDLLHNPENPKEKRNLELEELADFLVAESRVYADKNTGRVFTMVEFIFKKSASAFKQLIEESAHSSFFDEILVLSGTILEPRRREIINFVKRNAAAPLKVLLITTQVVEAGVDIDMDLGFKNISLIDSDEQLAGRINRNIKKPTCEVFLFKVNEPNTLYKKDLRFAITRDQLSIEDHQQILSDKNFDRLYNEVLLRVNNTNGIAEGIENIHTAYLPALNQLDFYIADKEFKLIDADNVSIFVPMDLPTQIEAAQAGLMENIFEKSELEFLASNHAYTPGEQFVNGEKVWSVYRNHLRQKKEMDFFEKRVEAKKLQGILSKFTFSIFKSPDTIQKLTPFMNESESLEEYLVLQPEHDELYEYHTGLKESYLDSVDARIF